MTTTKVSNSSKARLPKRQLQAKSSKAISALDVNSVTSPWEEEVRSLKAALADLQMKRLSALRLYQEEKVLRQQETGRAEQLAAEVRALEDSKAETHTASTSESRNFASKNDTMPVCDVQQADDASLLESDAGNEPGKNYEPNKSNNLQDSVLVQSDSHTSIQGFDARVAMVARLPPSLPTSLTWHSLSMTDILPPPPEVVVFLSSLTTNPERDGSNSDDTLNSKGSSSSQRTPAPMASEGFNTCNSPVNDELQQAAFGSDGNDREIFFKQTLNDMDEDASNSKDNGERERVPDPICDTGKMFRMLKQPPSISDCKTASPHASPDCIANAVRTNEEPAHGSHIESLPFSNGKFKLASDSGPSPPENVLAELSDLRKRLKIAESEAARASHELKQSTRLMADMKQQLDASTSACKDMIDTIMDQEKTIINLSQKEHNA